MLGGPVEGASLEPYLQVQMGLIIVVPEGAYHLHRTEAGAVDNPRARAVEVSIDDQITPRASWPLDLLPNHHGHADELTDQDDFWLATVTLQIHQRHRGCWLGLDGDAQPVVRLGVTGRTDRAWRGDR